MKRTTPILPLLCTCALALAAAVSVAVEPAGPVIFGVAKFVVGTDSIQISRDDSLSSGLDLIPGDAGSTVSVNRIEIKVGDSFTVSDRKHVSAVYKLLRITGGSALIEEVHWAGFPGAKESRSARTMLIRTYGVAAAQ